MKIVSIRTWRPMIMNFLELYELEERKKVHSKLAEIDEKYSSHWTR